MVFPLLIAAGSLLWKYGPQIGDAVGGLLHKSHDDEEDGYDEYDYDDYEEED